MVSVGVGVKAAGTRPEDAARQVVGLAAAARPGCSPRWAVPVPVGLAPVGKDQENSGALAALEGGVELALSLQQ